MIKTIRPSGNFIIETQNWYLKIPYRSYAWKENHQEIKNLQTVKADSHFFKHLPSYKNFGPVIKTEKLRNISKDRLPSFLISYFEKAFCDEDKWPLVELKNVMAFEYLRRFMESQKNKETEKILGACELIKIPQSSSHGDFHPENVMADKNGRLKFIDWTRYNSFSSLYFDLIDYFIFNQKESEEIWFEYWNKLCKEESVELFGIEIKKEYLLAYAFWKISEELKTLYIRKMLNRFKIKKYRNFLKIISELC